jgi:phosphoenolpyruvate carboxykinase (ATP)
MDAGAEHLDHREASPLSRTCVRAPALLHASLTAPGPACWLVNTGWTGGGFGTGRRMAIDHTRALLRAALDGALQEATFQPEPFFGLRIPQHVRGIPDEVLDPRRAWADGAAYDTAAAALAARFEANFATFADLVGDDVRRAAIHAA